MASSPEAITSNSSASGYFDIKLRSFATVEQANAYSKLESDSEVAVSESNNMLENLTTRKGLARNMVEHGLR
jgi:hypothetical protein